MSVSIEIRKNTYYDSVTLMLITKEIKKLPGVKAVIVGMGTGLNKELTQNLGLYSDKVENLSPNDFFIALSSDNDILKDVINKVDELINKKDEGAGTVFKTTTLSGAVRHLKGANLALISIPGKYAADEAKKALEAGLHVMIFSDNVSVDEEIELKKLGKEKGLLVMGPDCGTAIINHVPLCFANSVRKGDIGIVGASGTGTQEVSVLIDKLGGGISQAIGTGGRDLSAKVGGIMMAEGFKALADNSETKVIVLISKPPAREVADKILALTKTTNKPVVVCFIGEDRELIRKSGAHSCISLEDAAFKAVTLSKGKSTEDFTGFSASDNEIEKIVDTQASKFHESQKYLRALYTGGTLADEAMKLFEKENYMVYSNIPLSPELKLPDPHTSKKNSCIDLGDDDFTVGKPHPMIDPVQRAERLLKEANDGEVAVVLMDFVLGYGSNADPAGEMLPNIIRAKSIMKDSGKYLCMIGYICGTDKDPQDYNSQKEKLEQAGVVLMPSNAQAVRLAIKILNKIKHK